MFILIDPDVNLPCWNFSKWLSLRKDIADNVYNGVIVVKNVKRATLPEKNARRLRMDGSEHWQFTI